VAEAAQVGSTVIGSRHRRPPPPAVEVRTPLRREVLGQSKPTRQPDLHRQGHSVPEFPICAGISDESTSPSKSCRLAERSTSVSGCQRRQTGLMN
jgi:hypothetical protein